MYSLGSTGKEPFSVIIVARYSILFIKGINYGYSIKDMKLFIFLLAVDDLFI